MKNEGLRENLLDVEEPDEDEDFDVIVAIGI